MTDLELPELVRCDISGISFYTDEGLFDATGTRIAFTTRHGGFSEAPYDGLNLGLHVNDDRNNVIENRHAALSSIGATEDVAVVCPNQVHGDNVCVIDASEGDRFDLAVQEAHTGADALVVTCEDVCAMLCYADCMPVILVAPSGAFCVVHAGWRGVVSRIAEKALAVLCEETSARPSEVNAYIGPYIHVECFEVGSDTYREFASEFKDEVEDVCIDGDHVDLGAAMRCLLTHAGIPANRIADIGVCTSCNDADFYSYRASGGTCGRHGAMAFRR